MEDGRTASKLWRIYAKTRSRIVPDQVKVIRLRSSRCPHHSHNMLHLLLKDLRTIRRLVLVAIQLHAFLLRGHRNSNWERRDNRDNMGAAALGVGASDQEYLHLEGLRPLHNQRSKVRCSRPRPLGRLNYRRVPQL